jgi:steroid 5-alpha reductase family enzyme
MNKIINVVISLFSFLIAYVIAYSTGLSSVVMAVCIAYSIQWLLFLPAYIFQTEKFYDLSGGLTYITVVIFSLVATSDEAINPASLIIAIFIVIWAIRLSSFLFLRISKDGEDKRFRSIKPNLTQFFMTWTLQGMWVSLCSMCALTAINTGRLEIMNIFFILGACIFIIGLYIEIKADNQKSRFRSIPENRDRFITEGLWSKSRHPNYFGEILLWSGVAVMSVSALEGLQYITLISPIFTYLLLVHVSGVRMLEARANIKWGQDPEYKNYVENTPMLFPKL